MKVRKNDAGRQAETTPSPLPLRAQLEQFLAILRQRATSPRREQPGVRTRVVPPRPGIPRTGRYRPKMPMTGVPRRGHCWPMFLTRPNTDWHRRRLTLRSNTPHTKLCCSGNRHPIFRSGLLRRLWWTTYHTLAQSRIGWPKRLGFVNIIALRSSSCYWMTQSHTNARGVRNFGSDIWNREKPNAVLSGTYANLRRTHP